MNINQCGCRPYEWLGLDGNRCIHVIPRQLPREHSAAHPKVAFPEGGEGDRPGLQDRPAIPVGGGTVSPRGNGGIPCQVV